MVPDEARVKTTGACALRELLKGRYKRRRGRGRVRIDEQGLEDSRKGCGQS